MSLTQGVHDLATALAKAQGQMKNPEKNRTANIPTKAGGKYSYNYADLPSLLDAARRPLSDNGLSVSFVIEEREKGAFLVGYLLHASGQYLASEYRLFDAQDAKLLAAQITYGKRYLFQSMVGLAGEDDTDSVPESPDSTYTSKKIGQIGLSVPVEWPAVEWPAKDIPSVMDETAPQCCGKPMMVSKYPDKELGATPWYCLTCKKKLARF